MDSFIAKNDSLLTEFMIKENYVVFYSEDKYQRILKQPIHVANWEKGRKKEVWENDTNCDAIYNFVFANTSRESLRIHERNNAHRHVKINMTTVKLENWRDDFIEFLNNVEERYQA
jgi:hypothetical protein